MATIGQFYWPSVGTFVAAYGQFFMAANSDLHDECDRVDQRALPEGGEGPRAFSERDRWLEMPVSGHEIS